MREMGIRLLYKMMNVRMSSTNCFARPVRDEVWKRYQGTIRITWAASCDILASVLQFLSDIVQHGNPDLVVLDFGEDGAQWCATSAFRGPPAFSGSASFCLVSGGSGISRNSPLLRCSRTGSRPCSSHFTEVPDPADTDEPVERRELEDVTDAGRSDEPLDHVTEDRRAVFVFSTESRLG